MKQLTCEIIRSYRPCYDPAKYLEESWKGTILDVLNMEKVSFQDRLWVIMRNDLVSDRLMRLFAVWCARQVLKPEHDQRSQHAVDVAEAFAEYYDLVDDQGYREAWREELYVAWDAALSAARAAAESAAESATLSAAWDAALSAARAAAWSAAESTARDAAWSAARAAAESVAWSAAESATLSAADYVAWLSARRTMNAAQEEKLREMILEGIKTGEVY